MQKLPCADLKELLTKLSLSDLHDKLVSERVTVERAQRLGKADFLAVLNEIGVPVAARYDIAGAIFLLAPPRASPLMPPSSSLSNITTNVMHREAIAHSSWQLLQTGMLRFRQGDSVLVLGEFNDGWSEGEANGKRGRFPSFAIVELPAVRRAANQGNAAAQYELGVRYSNGFTVEADEHEALIWLRKAADQGHAWAQFDTGICYEYGKGVTMNECKAVKWFRKAADQGNPDAQYSLGLCYESATGVTKNEREAVMWYRKAADQGLAIAQDSLGLCYEKGIGVEKDEREAVKWYRKAADQGDETAQNNLRRVEVK